ncbi:hypothetical protein H112_04917 [Trichophyton rubrum D6]|nr:hypothetical protein H100_04939 [Trichophyton rubrum MR850]EZF41214.1 hypothetical protein H102_04925 [Trichophyton rubrum CBS 100081]EZF51873.1 hypothetical protein H103_04929 [Trichophyton rubrum CBS 288.86]EZF62460.1 hypothetical protein H104_04920 [Trichophyton rubrum CBS 289.86]EZF73098.1 hypothetical protein H105_04945 [Trichophyton soudanense CBS 452.61]EZF83779.1 hypothetical protein H110_04926 [Trichophyton rubrum MR1448]EZG16024.1 hypothetical protein H107_05058 [Trichophyton rub
MERGFFLSSSGRVVAYQNQRPDQIQGNKSASSEQSQETINAEARDAIKDLFPNIPTKDLNQIVKTAFKKGKRRVGTATELPLARRAQLAVVAHIRHIYTSYDRLLKMTSFQEARASVEEPTLAKLVLWRGDDENGTTVLEDVFREVIVISDDEDDERDGEEQAAELPLPPPPPRPHHEIPRESMELVSRNTTERQVPLNYGTPRDSHFATRSFAPQNSRQNPSSPSVITIDTPSQHSERRTNDHRGFRRYEAWDRARTRYSHLVNGAAAPAVPEQRSPRYSQAKPRQGFPGRGEDHRVRLSPSMDCSIIRATDSSTRRDVVTDHAQPASPYTPRRITALKETEPERHRQLPDHSPFSSVIERSQIEYDYRQSPSTSSNLQRANRIQSRLSYPPSGLAHHGLSSALPQSQAGSRLESRDYPIVPSIESPMAPISRPERSDSIPRNSPRLTMMMPDMRPTENGPPPSQLDQHARHQERHWDGSRYSRVVGTPQRLLPITVRNDMPSYNSHVSHLDEPSWSPSSGGQHHQHPQSQPLRSLENMTRSPLLDRPRVVRVAQPGQADPEQRYIHHTGEHHNRERGVVSSSSHQSAMAATNLADAPRRITSRYPYPDNPAIVIRQRHSLNPRLVAYPADTDNHLAQVRVYDRPVETRTSLTQMEDGRHNHHHHHRHHHPAGTTPLENWKPALMPDSGSRNRHGYAYVEKQPYSYIVDSDRPPGPAPAPVQAAAGSYYPSATSAFRSYRSPPPPTSIRSSESSAMTSTLTRTWTAPELGPSNGPIRSQQPYTHRPFL